MILWYTPQNKLCIMDTINSCHYHCYLKLYRSSENILENSVQIYSIKRVLKLTRCFAQEKKKDYRIHTLNILIWEHQMFSYTWELTTGQKYYSYDALYW